MNFLVIKQVYYSADKVLKVERLKCRVEEYSILVYVN